MDATGKELTAHDLFDLFEREYGVHSIPAPRHQVLEETAGATGALVRLAADVEVSGRQLTRAGRRQRPDRRLRAGAGRGLRCNDPGARLP